MRLTEGPERLHAKVVCQRRNFSRDPTLADTRRSHQIHEPAVASDGAVQIGLEGGHLPPATDQFRLGTAAQVRSRADREEAARADGFIDSLDADPFRF